MKNQHNLLWLSILLFAGCLAQLAGAAVATVTWSGAGPDQNWSDSANWSGGTPASNIVVFPAAMFPASTNVLGATNNIVDSSVSVSQLWYMNTNNLISSGSNAYDTTLISPYVTLTVNSNFYVGPDNGANATTVAAMVGTNCALIVSNVNATFGVGYTNNASSVQAVTFTLPDGTNFIDVGTFAIGNSDGGNGRQSILNLGNGTNIINAGVIELGISKAQGRIQFGGPNGGVMIGGTNGTRAEILVGRGTSGTASVNGQLMLTNYAYVLASSVTNGWGSTGSSGGSPQGTIAIQEGVFDTTTLVVGANTGGTQSASGTFTIGGGASSATLVVNSPSGPGGGVFVLSGANNGTQTGTGTFNINANGTAALYCSVNKVQVADNTATVNLNGGTLILEAATNVMGTAAIPMDTVNLNGGTLQLSVNGNNTSAANITANSVNASTTYGMNIINIGSVTNVTIPLNIPLIKYVNGGDPGLGNFQLGTVPAGYIATLQDNVNGDNSIDLSISANVPIYSLLWVGAVGSTLNSHWDFTTADWLNLTNGSPMTYTNPDLVYFDDTASNTTINLTTNFLSGAFTFSNSVLNYTLTGTGSIGGPVGFEMDGYALVTLAESSGDNFAGGVVVNSGTVILDDANSAIGGGAAIANGATLQIGNNDANGNLPSASVLDNGSLIFDQTTSSTVTIPITGSGSVTLNGSGTVTLSSAANAYTGNTMVNAGKLALTGSGTISNSQSVAVSGAMLDVSGVSGVTLFNNMSLNNATVTVNLTNTPYLQAPINVLNGSLNMSGTANTINVATLPAMAAYPSTLTIIQAVGGLNGYNLQLGTLPAGYSGYITNNYENGSGPNNAVELVLTSGPIGIRPYVTWSGLDAFNNVSTNWSDALNWQLAGAPLPSDTVIFNTAGAQTSSALSSPGGGPNALNFAYVNNIVDTNFAVSTLIYTNVGNSGSSYYQNTYITNGATLTITNSLAVGSASADFGSSATEFVSVSGTNGTLTVTNGSAPLLVGLVDANNSGEQATLDLSALGTFNATVSSFEVGGFATTADFVSGIAYLAATNTILAVGGLGAANEAAQDEALSLLVGETGKGGASESYLYLGQQNIIHAYTIGIGIAKDSGEIQFNPAWSNPTATIIGGDGVSPVQVWAIGDALAQTGTSAAPAGTADFTGGTVNATVATMYIGRSPNASGARAATGTLTLGTGAFAVNTLYNGFQAYNNTDYGTGTINVNGPGALLVNTLNLAWTTGTTGSSPTTGTLTINGGAVQAGTIAADTNNIGQSSITLNNNATLIVTNTIGSSAAPLYSLTLNGGTLQLNPNALGTNIVATSVSIGGSTTINIASVGTSVGGPLQIALISYLNGSDPGTGNLVLGTLPLGYSSASLSDDGVSHIYLNITAPAALVWAGALSGGSLDGNWNTSDQNWLNGATYAAYANPDLALFNDTARGSTVTVAAPVSPDSLVVSNNVLNYTFTGANAISGTGGLTKQGTGSLTLTETGGDSFRGGITVIGGTVTLDNANSAISGNTTIAAAGVLQVGNNDANGNLPGTVTANGTLILDRTNNMNLANAISGAGTIMQAGSNTVTLSSANSLFTGKLMVTNGILNTTLNTGLGAASATTMVTNGGTFDDNGISFNGVAAPALFVSGAGYNGAGAIINSGAAQTTAFSNVTVTANVIFGGTNRWDIRAGTGSAASLNMYPAGTPYSITKVGTNEIALVNVGTIDAGLGNIYVQQGEFAVQEGTVQLGNPASNIVVSAGGTLELYGLTTPLNKVITFNGSGATDSFKSDNSSASQNIVLGPVTLNGNCWFDISSNVFATFGGVIGGSGGLTKITQGTLTLTNVNAYTGATVVSNGVLALTGSGSIATSSTIALAAGATLNAAGTTNQTLALSAGQTLNGFGTVTGIVTTASGSTLAPGATGSIGTLTFGNNVTLAGTTAMKVSRVAAATNDVLNVAGTLAVGGTLNVTSLGGTFVAGDSFKLFTAAGISGTFAATNLPALGGGLGWVTTNLANGILTVVTAVNSNPPYVTNSIVGNTLTLTWPVGNIGWTLQAQTNTLGAGLNPNPAAWVNVPNATGGNTFSTTINPSNGTVFYRLVLNP